MPLAPWERNFITNPSVNIPLDTPSINWYAWFGGLVHKIWRSEQTLPHYGNSWYGFAGTFHTGMSCVLVLRCRCRDVDLEVSSVMGDLTSVASAWDILRTKFLRNTWRVCILMVGFTFQKAIAYDTNSPINI